MVLYLIMFFKNVENVLELMEKGDKSHGQLRKPDSHSNQTVTIKRKIASNLHFGSHLLVLVMSPRWRQSSGLLRLIESHWNSNWFKSKGFFLQAPACLWVTRQQFKLWFTTNAADLLSLTKLTQKCRTITRD